MDIGIVHGFMALVMEHHTEPLLEAVRTLEGKTYARSSLLEDEPARIEICQFHGNSFTAAIPSGL